MMLPAGVIAPCFGTIVLLLSMARSDATVSCGFTANVTKDLQYFTSPNYPENYPNNIVCAWVFQAPPGYRISLRFLDIQIESCCDTIKISDEEESTFIFVPKPPDNTFITKTNVLSMWFETNRDTTFRGFKVSYTIDGAGLPSDTNDICLVEDELALSAGETRYLQSPNYPSDYPSDKDCTVTIVAPPGYFLNITFEDSELEDFWDYIKVSNADEQVPELNPTRFDNALNGSTVYQSPGRKIVVQFVSDNSVVVEKGFRLVYTAVPEESRPPPEPDTRSPRTISVCSRRPVYASQLIASISVSDVIKSPSGWPSWNSKYSGNLDCTVTIVAPHGHVISISIEKMQTETCCDKLTITNNDPKVTEEFSRRYSGFILVGLPQVFTTPGRSVSVRFVTDDGIEYDGFRFSYRAIPDPKLETTPEPTTTVPETTQPTTTTTTTAPTTQAATTVSSTTAAPCGFNATASELPRTLNAPGEPERYQNDGRCEWFITARPGYVVNFTYTGFRGGWCCDSMEVYDGDLLLTKLENTQDPGSFLAWSGTLRLVYNVQNRFFRSTFQGFFIESSPLPTTPEPERTSSVTRDICALPPQVRVYTFSDELQSPNFPDNYPNNQDCTVRLVAPPGYVVSFFILTVETEAWRQYGDFLTFRNADPDFTDDIIQQYSGDQKGWLFKSPGRKVDVQFKSDSRDSDRGFKVSYNAYRDPNRPRPPSTTTPATETTHPMTMTTTTTRSTTIGTRLPNDTNDICMVEGELQVDAGKTRYLQSPNYPSDYPLNKDCTVVVVAPIGYFLNITFEDFKVEYFWDYVQFKNADDQVPELNPSIRFSSVVNSSTVYLSPGRKLFVHFVSDNGVVERGFRIAYTAVPEELRPLPVPDTRPSRSTSVCEKRPVYAPQLIASISVSDAIKSPGERKYSSNLDCAVTIVAPHRYVLSISIESMGTETCCDFLTITNNDPKVTEKFSRRYSGFILVGLPQVFTTPGRSVSVRFTSDDGIEYRGFRFSYRAIPDPQLETTLAPTTTVSDSPAIQHYLLDDATLTYDTARQHCIDNGADLCLKSDICINYVPVIIGIQDGDHWTPVRNGYNDWVEVGNDNDPDGKGRVCFRHNELYSAPRWGTTPGPCPPWNPRKICDIKSHVFCCRNISSN